MSVSGRNSSLGKRLHIAGTQYLLEGITEGFIVILSTAALLGVLKGKGNTNDKIYMFKYGNAHNF